MNTSDIKKLLIRISLLLSIILLTTIYNTYQNSSTPTLTLKDYTYQEKTNQNKSALKRGYNLKDLNTTFKVKSQSSQNDSTCRGLRPIARKTQNPERYPLELHMLMGNLAFIKITQDNEIKSYLINNEIRDNKNHLIGILKEIHTNHILVLINEKLKKFSFSEQQHSNNSNVTTQLKPTHNVALIPLNKSLEINRKKNSNRSTHYFNGRNIKVIQSVDLDGVIHIKIPRAFAKELQSKKIKEILLTANNYQLNYSKKGLLIKSIKNNDIKKIFHIFGIQQNDLILKINGQSLGNKSEDDVIQLIQELNISAKYITIKLIKNKKQQTFRISVDSIKKQIKQKLHQ